jgi:5-methylcytosine-specific restriction endonuclease McrA
MHNLKLTGVDPTEYFNAIVDAKTGDRGERLGKLKKRVAGHYAELEAAFNSDDIANIPTNNWKSVPKADLLHCYESTSSALQQLKRLITAKQRDGVRGVCPYCGNGAPRQFDHYLPKAKFPEFSVHAYNLVPCCGTCNGIKSETWLNGAARSFINFYIDSLPTSPMVKPTVTWHTKGKLIIPAVSYDLVRPARFNRSKFALIETHFEQLGLLERYKDDTHTEFIALRDTAIGRGAGTTKTLRRFLEDTITQRENTLGPLSWKNALHRELTRYTPFLESCLKKGKKT